MKILIVDDDDVMIMLLTRIVKNMGYVVISAQDGKKAIELIETQLPAIVITDMVLPIFSGLEIVSYLKDLPGKQIPVILLSAMPESALQNKHGADAYFVKPVHPEILKNKIEELSQVRIYKKETILVL